MSPVISVYLPNITPLGGETKVDTKGDTNGDTNGDTTPSGGWDRWENPSPNPNQEEGCPAFVGGGAGIALSRAAALQIVARVRNGSAACDPYHRKWASRRHQGGDAWLGDCAEAG